MAPPKPGQLFQGLPELDFVQGTSPDSANRKPLLVEAWATWCPPCKANIPHVQKMWEDFGLAGELDLVAVAVRENGDPEDVRERIEKFIKDKGSQMTYPVAIDGPPLPEGRDGAFADQYLAAGKATLAIPWCYLVDREGKVAYMGKPEFLMDKVEKVIAGTYEIPAPVVKGPGPHMS